MARQIVGRSIGEEVILLNLTHRVLEQEHAAGRRLPKLDELPRSADPHNVRIENPAAARAVAFLATETLYAKFGQQQIERFLVLFRTGHSVEDNFSLAFGTSYQEFIREAEAAIQRIASAEP